MHAEHGILTQAWSPIGGITSYRGGRESTFDDPTLLEIARPHGKSAAQVMLRWHFQEGRSAIPKSVRPDPHRRELRRLRLRALQRGARRHRRARHRRAGRTGTRRHHPRNLRPGDPGGVSPGASWHGRGQRAPTPWSPAQGRLRGDGTSTRIRREKSGDDRPAAKARLSMWKALSNPGGSTEI